MGCGLCACWCQCWMSRARRRRHDARYDLWADEAHQGTRGRMIDTLKPQGGYL